MSCGKIREKGPYVRKKCEQKSLPSQERTWLGHLHLSQQLANTAKAKMANISNFMVSTVFHSYLSLSYSC